MLKRAEAVDEAEDARYGEDARGDELPEELKRREDRLAAIRAAKARLAAEQRAMDDARGRKPGQSRNPKGGKPYKREYGEPDAKAQSNFTDPESRIMKTSSEGFQQCYNAQTVVDGDNQVVVATTVTESASDQGQLIPMVDAVRDAFGETPEQVLADAGYCSEPNLQALKERDIDGYVSLAREGTAVMSKKLASSAASGAWRRLVSTSARLIGDTPSQPIMDPRRLRSHPVPLLELLLGAHAPRRGSSDVTREWSLSEHTDFAIGPVFKRTVSDTTVTGNFVADSVPYGSGTVMQLGVQASLDLDGRDDVTWPTRGYHVTAGAAYYPQILDLDDGVVEAKGELATFLSPGGGNPTLATRVGGKHVWGTFPYYEAALLGGAENLRGLREQRFAGRSSLYGSAELRVSLGRLFLLFPINFGVFGFGDLGRVFQDDLPSDRWHKSYGGGIWLAPLTRATTFQISLARSEQRTAVYFGLGFAF